MNIKTLLVLLSLVFAFAPLGLAQIQHVDMRVEGMT